MAPDILGPIYLWLLILLAVLIPLPCPPVPPLVGDGDEHPEWW